MSKEINLTIFKHFYSIGEECSAVLWIIGQCRGDLNSWFQNRAGLEREIHLRRHQNAYFYYSLCGCKECEWVYSSWGCQLQIYTLKLWNTTFYLLLKMKMIISEDRIFQWDVLFTSRNLILLAATFPKIWPASSFCSVSSWRR